jgi:hypothetical protein
MAHNLNKNYTGHSFEHVGERQQQRPCVWNHVHSPKTSLFISRHGIAIPNSASNYEETQMFLKNGLDI